MHIDWFVLFAQIFNFLLLVYLLKRFLYGRIIQAMDAREAKIAARFEEAEEMKKKAAAEAEIYERQNLVLAEKSEQMLNQAKVDADEKRKQLMENVRTEVEQMKARWQDMLLREQEAFFHDLRSRAAHQVYAAARRALTDLADADLEERIVEEFIHRVQTLDDKQKDEIRKAMTGGSKVVVQSAFVIPDGIRKRIEDVLQKQISHDFSIRYLMEPDVISGIELRVNGHKIAWSLNEYLETLVESLSETLQKEAHAG